MMAHHEQDFYNKNFSLQDQGKGKDLQDPIDTFENRINIWPSIFNNDEGPIPYNLFDYEYNNESFDYSVHGAEIILHRRELKKVLDILRSK